MYFKQIVKEDLGCACYIVGCPDAGACAVVDPRIDMVEEILRLVAEKGMSVTAIIETHNHADHIAGHGELAERTGAPIYVHELAEVAYPHTSLKDGDVLDVGAVRLHVLHTPGHRPEHIALTVADRTRSNAPWLVLTGDSLFVGDVARPDLAVSGEEGAEALYHSLFRRLLALKDHIELYPGHLAGSLCGRGMNAKTSSTIGFERRHNQAIQFLFREAFIASVNKNLPQRPPNMARIVERNRGREVQRLETASPTAMAPQRLQQEIEAGAQLIDTRSPEQFGAGHIPGAINVFLRGSAFATRAGFVAKSELPLLLVVRDEKDLRDAFTQLQVVGFDRVIGYLDGGMEAWQEAGLPVQPLRQMTVEELHNQRQQLHILDVRDQGEWDAGHIEGALHIPYYQVEQHIAELAQMQPLAVLCASGQRSTLACSLLQKHGVTELANVIGGMDAWKKQAFAVMTAEAAHSKR